MEGWKPFVFRGHIYRGCWVFSLSCSLVSAGPAVSSAELHLALCEKSAPPGTALLRDAARVLCALWWVAQARGTCRGETVLCVRVFGNRDFCLMQWKMITTWYFPVWEASLNSSDLGRSPSWHWCCVLDFDLKMPVGLNRLKPGFAFQFPANSRWFVPLNTIIQSEERKWDEAYFAQLLPLSLLLCSLKETAVAAVPCPVFLPENTGSAGLKGASWGRPGIPWDLGDGNRQKLSLKEFYRLLFYLTVHYVRYMLWICNTASVLYCHAIHLVYRNISVLKLLTDCRYR